MNQVMANETKIYGISNCDTVKKARNWMERNGINYVFHDYKKSGITKDLLELWVMQVGWEPLLNKRGTTFKKLPDMMKDIHYNVPCRCSDYRIIATGVLRCSGCGMKHAILRQ